MDTQLQKLCSDIDYAAGAVVERERRRRTLGGGLQQSQFGPRPAVLPHPVDREAAPARPTIADTLTAVERIASNPRSADALRQPGVMGQLRSLLSMIEARLTRPPKGP